MVKTEATFKELRKEFNAPKAKMVVATLGQTNKDTAIGNEKLIIDGMFPLEIRIRERPLLSTPTQLAWIFFQCSLWRNAKTYMNVGLAMGEAMVRLLRK